MALYETFVCLPCTTLKSVVRTYLLYVLTLTVHTYIHTYRAEERGWLVGLGAEVKVFIIGATLNFLHRPLSLTKPTKVKPLLIPQRPPTPEVCCKKKWRRATSLSALSLARC